MTYREIWKQSGAQIRGEADKRTGGVGVSVSKNAAAEIGGGRVEKRRRVI